MQRTITVEQAEQQVEDYFRQALAVLPDQAKAEPGLIHTVDCDDPTDNGPAGRKTASVNYQILGLRAADYPAYVDDLERWWHDHDFRILDDDRPAEQSVWVENTKDGFRMRVQDNPLGELYLIVSSPCVWPDGTPSDQ